MIRENVAKFIAFFRYIFRDKVCNNINEQDLALTKNLPYQFEHQEDVKILLPVVEVPMTFLTRNCKAFQ